MVRVKVSYVQNVQKGRPWAYERDEESMLRRVVSACTLPDYQLYDRKRQKGRPWALKREEQ